LAASSTCASTTYSMPLHACVFLSSCETWACLLHLFSGKISVHSLGVLPAPSKHEPARSPLHYIPLPLHTHLTCTLHAKKTWLDRTRGGIRAPSRVPADCASSPPPRLVPPNTAYTIAFLTAPRRAISPPLFTYSLLVHLMLTAVRASNIPGHSAYLCRRGTVYCLSLTRPPPPRTLEEAPLPPPTAFRCCLFVHTCTPAPAASTTTPPFH